MDKGFCGNLFFVRNFVIKRFHIHHWIDVFGVCGVMMTHIGCLKKKGIRKYVLLCAPMFWNKWKVILGLGWGFWFILSIINVRCVLLISTFCRNESRYSNKLWISSCFSVFCLFRKKEFFFFTKQKEFTIQHILSNF